MMNLLLDTHIILWLASDNSKLSAKAKHALADENNVRYVSIASAWEVAIKLGAQKLRFDGGLSEFYRVIDHNDFYETGVNREYLNLLEKIEDIHKDPFDRLLIATALAENFTLVTADENIHKYKVNWLW
jgi:PIN domain nuclease of toxin-antitoxin system